MLRTTLLMLYLVATAQTGASQMPVPDTISCSLAAGAAGSGNLDATFSWQGAVAVVHEVRVAI